MRVEPRLAAFACAAVGIWSCNALWGVDDLSFDGTTTTGAGRAGAGGATSSTTTGGSGGVTTTIGGAGGMGGQPAACLEACNDLFDCGLEDGNCPGFAEDQRPSFVEGCEPGAGCVAACETMPTLLSFIDPDNCAGTIETISSVDSDFEAACINGAGGCGGGGGTAGFGPG